MMKKCGVYVVLFLIATCLGAVNLLDEDFSGTFPPEGWTRSGMNNGENWGISNSNYADGIAPEVSFTYYPVSEGEQFLISPLIDASTASDVNLSFYYAVDHYSSALPYTVGVMVYGADEEWTTIWSITPTEDISAEQEMMCIDDSMARTGNLQIAFFFEGNSNAINYFYLDNVELTAEVGIVSGTWETGQTYHINSDLTIPDGETLTIEPGVTIYYHGEYNFNVEGSINACGTTESPITFAPVNPGISTGHIALVGSGADGSYFDGCHFSGVSVDEGDGPDYYGGAVMMNEVQDVLFTDCVFESNIGGNGGGAIAMFASSATISNCRFQNNMTYENGGAIYLFESNLEMDHCLLEGGSAHYGGAVYMSDANSATLDHCTISNNVSSFDNADFNIQNSSGHTTNLTFTNSVWWDSSTYLTMCNAYTLVLNVYYCDLQNVSAYAGSGYSTDQFQNISADPLWDGEYNPTWSSYPAHDEYRSPLIDAGNPDETDPDGTVTDLGWKYYDQGLHISGEVSGTWSIANSPYLIGGDITVPDNEILVIEPGVVVQYDGPWVFAVYGAIQANGTEDNPIIFEPSFEGIDTGHFLITTPQEGGTYFHWCEFRDHQIPQTWSYDRHGGAMYLYFTQDIEVENCTFINNYSPLTGGAVSMRQSTATFHGCRFIDNVTDGDGGNIYGYNGTLDIDHCLFSGGIAPDGPILYYYLGGEINIDHCSFTGNTSTVHEGDISCYSYGGNLLNVAITNSVWWGNSDCLLRAGGSGTTNFSATYCDLEYPECIEGSAYTSSLSDNIVLDPLWDENCVPTWVSCPDDNELKSPLIDAGDPQFTRDLDGSITDIGYVYYDQSLPIIAHVHDVPGDQGRSVQIFWRRSEHDSQYDFDNFYAIWRLDDLVRTDSDIILDSPDQVREYDVNTRQRMLLRYDDTYWAFVVAVPALTNHYYVYNAPTLADSSSVGQNDTTFMIVLYTEEGTWASNSMSGYSVDNIVPDAVRSVDIESSGQNVTLAWQPVSTGSLHGNSYPEINGIWYRVFAATDPNFVCDESTYRFTTQNSSIQLPVNSQQRLFYRVVVSDQP